MASTGTLRAHSFDKKLRNAYENAPRRKFALARGAPLCVSTLGVSNRLFQPISVVFCRGHMRADRRFQRGTMR
jgi:hypothetical protein